MPDDALAQLPFARWLRRQLPSAEIVYRSNALLGLFEAVKYGIGSAGFRTVVTLSHSDLRRTVRIRALMDFLSEAIDTERMLMEG